MNTYERCWHSRHGQPHMAACGGNRAAPTGAHPSNAGDRAKWQPTSRKGILCCLLLPHILAVILASAGWGTQSSTRGRRGWVVGTGSCNAAQTFTKKARAAFS